MIFKASIKENVLELDQEQVGVDFKIKSTVSSVGCTGPYVSKPWDRLERISSCVNGAEAY